MPVDQILSQIELISNWYFFGPNPKLSSNWLQVGIYMFDLRGMVSNPQMYDKAP